MSLSGCYDKSRLWCRSFMVFGVVLVVMGLWCSSVGAHAPYSVSLRYDGSSGLLTVKVAHVSGDLTLHHISRLTISLNDNVIPDDEITLDSWDENNSGLVATYYLAAKQNDTIIVVADCSVEGSASGKILVDLKNGSKTSTPGFEFAVVVGAVCLVWMMNRRLRGT